MAMEYRLLLIAHSPRMQFSMYFFIVLQLKSFNDEVIFNPSTKKE